MLKLAEDIDANGLKEPIVLTPDGLLLDGRNRDLACQMAGKKITTVVYKGDPVRFVITKNLHRRQLTQSKSELTAIAAELATIKGGGPPKKNCAVTAQLTSAELAKKFSVSESVLRHAMGVKNKAPRMFGWIKEGRITVDYATKALQVKPAWDTPEEAKSAAKELREHSNARVEKNSQREPKQRLRMVFPDRTGHKPLTQADVDPKFKGTPAQFAAKYGHNPVMNAEQYATMYFGDWVSFARETVMLAHRLKIKDLLKSKKPDHNWLHSPKQRDIIRLKEALDELDPIMKELRDLFNITAMKLAQPEAAE